VGHDLRAGLVTRDRDRVVAAVEAHAADILSYLARRVDPPEEAADLLSDVLTVLWKKAGVLPTNEQEVRPWMFGVAHKTLQRHYRSRSRQRAIADRLRSMLSVTEHPGLASDERLDLRRAVAGLDRIDRDIIGLVHWEGFTLAEASRVMGMKEGTVRSRYHRARATLRTRLTAESEQAPSETRGR
jgi:RNA polymerase sigma-70 factor (ECF subfamily)